MSRLLYGPGARGPAIETIQCALNPGRPDGVYGKQTADAIAAFQRANGLAVSGDTDLDTWLALVRSSPPHIFERCLALTAAFEGHGFSLAQGNFDGAGITWVIIGFTLRSGSLGEVIGGIDAKTPEAVDAAFGPLAQVLREELALPVASRLEWAQILSTGVSLAEPWRLAFHLLGAHPAARREQLEVAHRLYFQRAKDTAHELRLTDELGQALCFDIQVQNGGVKARVRRQLLDHAGTAKERRELLARLTAASASPEWRADVLARKLTLAQGMGRVHGRYYHLANWALDEYPLDEVLDPSGPKSG